MKVSINKRGVEEDINKELINILQTCTSLDQQNLIKVKELKEICLEKLIELGQVDWKKVCLQLHIAEPLCNPVAIDRLISHDHYFSQNKTFQKM